MLVWNDAVSAERLTSQNSILISPFGECNGGNASKIFPDMLFSHISDGDLLSITARSSGLAVANQATTLDVRSAIGQGTAPYIYKEDAA